MPHVLHLAIQLRGDPDETRNANAGGLWGRDESFQGNCCGGTVGGRTRRVGELPGAGHAPVATSRFIAGVLGRRSPRCGIGSGGRKLIELKMRRLFDTNAGWSGPIVRLGLGIVMFPHGMQKLMGWFGGQGLLERYHQFTEVMHFPAAVAVL